MKFRMRACILFFLFCVYISNAYAQIITTVAGSAIASFNGDGGPAISASLTEPTGVAIDAGGNIYIADYYNCRIRKVDASTGINTTIAGNGSFGFSRDGGPAVSASIWLPTGVAVDAGNNVYIADLANDRIRKVNALSGVITTIAGNGITGFSGDGGLTISAELFEHYGISLDAGGNLYIADYANNRIRKVGGRNKNHLHRFWNRNPGV